MPRHQRNRLSETSVLTVAFVILYFDIQVLRIFSSKCFSHLEWLRIYVLADLDILSFFSDFPEQKSKILIIKT